MNHERYIPEIKKKKDIYQPTQNDALRFLDKAQKNRDLFVALVLVVVGGVFVYQRFVRSEQVFKDNEHSVAQQVEIRLSELLEQQYQEDVSNKLEGFKKKVVNAIFEKQAFDSGFSRKRVSNEIDLKKIDEAINSEVSRQISKKSYSAKDETNQYKQLLLSINSAFLKHKIIGITPEQEKKS